MDENHLHAVSHLDVCDFQIYIYTDTFNLSVVDDAIPLWNLLLLFDSDSNSRQEIWGNRVEMKAGTHAACVLSACDKWTWYVKKVMVHHSI